MKRYIEIEDYIIDIDKIEYVYKQECMGTSYKYRTRITFLSGDSFSVDEKYYSKLKEILSPLCFKEFKFELDGVNDFPGDNMIEE